MKQTFAVILVLLLAMGAASAASLSPIEQLGKIMYQDKDFSFNATQSCQTCHHPVAGFADPTNSRDPYYTVVSLGDDGVSKGGRNAPSSAYAGYSPPLEKDDNGNWVGGLFWDGRATGLTATLGDPLAEQAQGPPLNPVEMGMPDKEAVVAVVRNADYADLFIDVFPTDSLDDVDVTFDNIARAIAAYERSVEVQKFNSRYDQGILTAQEQRGMALFATSCAQCHSMEDTTGEGPLFTSYTYANIGVPINPLLADNPEDLGLGPIVDDPAQNGKFKVPTLRNVGLSAPYSHNGYFPTLRHIVQFKNTRDVEDWEAPEVSANLNTNIGDLGLSDDEVDDIVAFLMTLTDSDRNR